MKRLTASQIALLRLQTLGLVAHEQGVLESPEDVARHHLAMQAQDWGASQWAIGSRLPGCTREDVLKAYDDGVIVRSWPMRGTVHVALAEDMPWMLGLMGVRALAGIERRWENLGFDARGKAMEQAREVAVQLLKGGHRATRSELRAALTDAGLDLSGQRFYLTVWYLAHTQTLISGPTIDGEQQLVLLDEWIPNPRVFDRDEALAELARRYLVARGPVTVEDLVHWSKLTKGDCKKAFAFIADDLVELAGPDTTYFMLREQFEQLDPKSKKAKNATLALAGFDEHLLGYRNRDAVLDPNFATMVDPGRNGVFRWTIVSGGQTVATWSRTKRARSIKVGVVPFQPLAPTVERKLQATLDRYGKFVGQPIEIAT